jgi:hypothetical protein
MEIETNLVVSSSHLSANDVLWLEAVANDEVESHLTVYSTEYWFLVYLKGIGSAEGKSFEKLFNFAKDKNFNFLKFDRDADVLPEFPTYDDGEKEEE